MLTWVSCAILGGLLVVQAARADDAVYRCESADGVSIQSTPCPKGATQRKIPFERPPESVAPPAAAAAPAPVSMVAGHPVSPANAIVSGPNDPYPLWQCMRADGSTYDSRDGVPGRQWAAKTEASEASDASDDADAATKAAQSAQLAKRLKKGGYVVRSYSGPTSSADSKDADAPPAGASSGQWVADQCTQLEPAQACARYAARRDALRKQIYASKPSERSLYAPEEQDLTSMLYATCGR
jgi:hypothetical protein